MLNPTDTVAVTEKGEKYHDELTDRIRQRPEGARYQTDLRMRHWVLDRLVGDGPQSAEGVTAFYFPEPYHWPGREAVVRNALMKRLQWLHDRDYVEVVKEDTQ